jgi:hypothetical protein
MTIDDQQDRLRMLLQPPSLAGTLFPPNSRYAGIGIAVYDPDGDRPVAYLRRRFVPRPEQFATLRLHLVSGAERPDQIAAEELGDPELFWRLCDANRALHPAELTAELGRWLRVPLPEGLPGDDDA